MRPYFSITLCLNGRPVRFAVWACCALAAALTVRGGGQSLLPPGLADSFTMRRWSLDEGLPDSLVCGVVPGVNGYLWLATARYLVRFDGLRFMPVPAPVGTGRNEGLFQDSRKGLWLYGSFGAVCYQNGAWQQNASAGLPPGRVVSIAEEADGRLCFALENALYERDGSGVRKILDHAAFPNETGPFRQLVAGPEGALWTVVGTGLYRWFPQRKSPPARMTGMRTDWVLSASSGGTLAAHGFNCCLQWRDGMWTRLPDARPVSARCLLEWADGTLWAGHDAGVDVFDKTRWHTQRSVVLHGPSRVLSMVRDREENVWLATTDGLVRLHPRVMCSVLERESGGRADVLALWAEQGGHVWAALRSGGLASGDATGLDPLLVPPGFSDVAPNALYREANGTLWCGGSGGCLWSLQNQSLQRIEGAYADGVRAMLGRGGPPTWVATRRGVLAFDAERNVLTATDWPQDPVLCLWQDADGTLWTGHESLGLAMRRPVGKVTFWPEAALPGRTVRALYRDGDGVLWIGGLEGLARWDGERRFIFRRSHGLWNASIRQIAEDTAGYLWLGTADGVMRIAKRNLAEVAAGRRDVLSVRTFGSEAGMEQEDCVGGVFFPVGEPPRDRLWFPTRSGLLTVEPKTLPPPRPAPVIHVTAVALGRLAEIRSVSDAAGLQRRRETADPRDVAVEYAALDFLTPERVRFRYVLSGPVQQRSGLTEERRVLFSRLPPGVYTFRVTACNGDGVWHPSGATVVWTVHPFFWETLGFRIGFLIVGVAGVGAAARALERRRVRRRLDAARREQGLARERARIARDLHDEIGAKLTRLSLLGAMAAEDAKDAEPLQREITEMADAARETHRAFDEIIWSVSPRNDTVRSLSHYICKYAEEFFSGTSVLSYSRLPDDLTDRPIDPQHRHQMFLAVKESLHNVLKHAGAARVDLSVDASDGTLRVTVQDDGCGFDPAAAASRGDGLRNMQERMKAVGGKLAINSAPGKGSCLMFEMPVKSDGKA